MQISLDKLGIRKRGVVKSVTVGDYAIRLLEMGLTKGASVELIRFAPLGDPMEIRLRGYRLSLRKQEAAMVTVEVEE